MDSLTQAALGAGVAAICVPARHRGRAMLLGAALGTLPDGVELAGFPGQREIAWQTNLVEGKNLLPLELIALTLVGGEVLARLEHDNRKRTFRLRIEVS